MVKPIRRDLLIYEVSFYEKNTETSDSGWGGEPGEYKEPVAIKNVRLEPKDKIVTTGDGEEIQSDTTMFVDAVFSDKANWMYDSKVVFNGREYYVKQALPFYARENEVHHWEVRLA